MAGQTGRALKLTTEQLQKADNALKKFGSKTDLAAALRMSRTTINNFFKGEPVQRKQFHAICKKLKLDWQPESPKPSQNDVSDIDELVRKVRSYCCSKILTTCNHIQLYTLKKIDLYQLFIPVFVSQEQNRQRESSQKNPPPSPALETVNRHQHLIIFGKPGAGKSTFSSYLALTCCDKDSPADWIPILLRLNDVDTRKQFNLLELLGVAFDTEQTITQLILKSGKVFLILDGLDEISSQFRQEICSEISNFITCFHANKILITCRSEVKDYKLPSVFDRVEFSEFDETQQNQFIKNWFSIANNDSASWLAVKLQQNPDCNSQTIINHLLSNDRLRELAKTPILLSLICLVYVSDGVLPKKRSLLYERGLDILLEQWDENRRVENRVESDAYETLSSDDKQKILSELARYKFEQTEDVLAFEQAEALKVIAQYRNISHQESLQILEGIAADHGLLFQSARKKWEFSHLTFQEYFVARWFVQHQDWQKLAHNLFNPLWRQVFLLTTEMSQSPDDLLLLMKQQIDKLMAGDEKLQRFLVWVDEKARSVATSYNFTEIIYFSNFIKIKYFYFPPYINLGINSKLDTKSFPELQLDQNLVEALYCASVFICIPPLVRDYDYFQVNRSLLLNFENVLRCKHNRELSSKLQALRNKLPEFIWKNCEYFKLWWQENGQDWKNQLRAVMIEHRNIGHDWQFSDAQQERLRQYYDANKLLVDCLNSDCNISRSVREEIEATLLLPVTQIERMKGG